MIYQLAVDLLGGGNHTVRIVWQIEGDELLLDAMIQATHKSLKQGGVVPPTICCQSTELICIVQNRTVTLANVPE